MRRGRFEAMGTTVEVWTETEQAFTATIEWFDLVERICSRFLADSELSRLNRHPESRVRVSPLLEEVIRVANDLRAATGGLHDIGVGRSVVEWGYDRTFAEVRDLPTAPVSQTEPWWSLDGSVVERAPGTRLDLGGVAKGWTCDIAVEAGLAVVVSAGGDIRSIHPETTVPILDPWGEVVTEVALGEGALATSSTTRRRWLVGGQTAHHLIDPRTGRPALSPIISASVVARSATRAEAGAKTVLLLGEEGLAWAADQEWIDGAVVVWDDGSVFATRGIAA